MRRARCLEWLGVAGAAQVVAAVLLFGWWQWGPIEPPFHSIRLDEHRAEYADGMLDVTRYTRVLERTTFEITRDLVRVTAPGAPRVRITLPSTTITYDPGEYDLTRSFGVPDAVAPGLYDLRFTVTWQANPVRRATVALPVLRVDITD